MSRYFESRLGRVYGLKVGKAEGGDTSNLKEGLESGSKWKLVSIVRLQAQKVNSVVHVFCTPVGV